MDDPVLQTEKWILDDFKGKNPDELDFVLLHCAWRRSSCKQVQKRHLLFRKRNNTSQKDKRSAKKLCVAYASPTASPLLGGGVMWDGLFPSATCGVVHILARNCSWPGSWWVQPWKLFVSYVVAQAQIPVPSPDRLPLVCWKLSSFYLFGITALFYVCLKHLLLNIFKYIQW